MENFRFQTKFSSSPFVSCISQGIAFLSLDDHSFSWLCVCSSLLFAFSARVKIMSSWSGLVYSFFMCQCCAFIFTFGPE